ncbi:MAG TPA: hypothetical protein VH518_00310 [Tepidisphaeraceae bacterium]|jgi:hypothetical protein
MQVLTSHPEPKLPSDPPKAAEHELLAFRSSVTVLDVRLLLALILNERGVCVSLRIGDSAETDDN